MREQNKKYKNKTMQYEKNQIKYITKNSKK